VATILKGLLVALLIGFSLQARITPGWLAGVLYGLLYGLAFGIIVFLAKGADFKTTPHVLSGSVIQGVITGALIALLAFNARGV
jgi:tetrahydromethanopterin S-methyltransferase subunit E